MKAKNFEIMVKADVVAKPKDHPSAGNVKRPSNLGLIQAIESHINSLGYNVVSITSSVINADGE